MYEFWAIFLLAFIFLIVFFIGSNKNRKLSIKYAKAIKELMTPYSDFVGFKSFGYSGFRSLCRLKKDEAFDKIEIAIALIDRENLMHYPLSFITKDYDRFVCWGFLKNKIQSNIEIFQKIDKKNYEKMVSQKGLKEIIIEEKEFQESFIFLTDNTNFTRKILLKPEIKEGLLNMKEFIKRLSLNREESWIYLIAELKEETLKPLLNLILSFGKALS
ncbi:MAG: hypothetical protein QXY18_00620 [Nitrososphaerota archaeon]